MYRQRVLFVCNRNSARSQIAEAFLNTLGKDFFTAESAGLEAGELNQTVVTCMQEVGIDISQNKTNDVFDFFKEGRRYQFVITVCNESEKERCPIFPGFAKRLHWSFADPSALAGAPEEMLRETRKIRDTIKEKIILFIEENK